MRIAVTHVTTYQYHPPVFLEPQVVRLCPRSDGAQRLQEFAIEMAPAPMTVSHQLDLEGNTVVEAAFLELTDHLEVKTRCVVDTLRADPFDFLLAPRATTLPLAYSDDERTTLLPYFHPQEADEAVHRLVDKIVNEAAHDTMRFLRELNRRLAETITMTTRPHGAPQSPRQTLDERTGACRDLAVLFIECCRRVGLAARFVSGYHVIEEEGERTLHAWAEVYLPGGGWRGFDPTQGLATADRHVAVAAGLTPERAAPFTGTFRGSGAEAVMSVSIGMEVLPQP